MFSLEELVENQGGEVVYMDSSHESVEKVRSISEVAAVLRFRIR